jgi:hypothetical protein|tara:strand:- start:464 stop:1087 length:624 start_codon:yes stop_codon:yes gene_type:complete
MPRGYLIDEQGIKRLREDHDILYKRVVQLEQRFSIGGGAVGAGVRVTAEFVKVTTQIGQRVTTTLGKGKAELYKITKDASDVATYEAVLDAAGDPVEVDVYNSSLVPVPVDAFIRISRDFRSGVWMTGEMQTAVAKAGASGVTARSGTTAGSGTVSVYSIVAGILTDTNQDVTAYSLSATAVANNAYITIKRCSLDEEWIVDAEDCG